MLFESCEKDGIFKAVSPSDDAIALRKGGRNATVSNNMLKFVSRTQVDAFLVEVEQARVDHANDDDSQQLRADIDPGLYEVEARYGYRSTSHLYDSLEYDNSDFRSTGAPIRSFIYLPDPELQTILNEDLEVWIADTIYKAVDNNRYYKIVGADIAVLESIRADPVSPDVTEDDGICYFDGTSPPITFREPCGAIVEVLSNTGGVNPRVTIRVQFVDQSEQLHFCNAATVQIDWGDGSGPQNFSTNVLQTHQYSAPAGQNVTFDIDVIITPLIPSLCGGCEDPALGETSVTFNNSSLCVSRQVDRLADRTFFSAGGDNWRADSYVGAEVIGGIFNSRKVWGELFLFRQRNNGQFQRKKPDEFLRVRDYGTVFKPDCNTVQDVFDSECQKRRNRLDCKVKIFADFTWQEIDPQWPKFDTKVFHTSTTIPDQQALGLKL